jgi:hypothetical protein
MLHVYDRPQRKVEPTSTAVRCLPRLICRFHYFQIEFVRPPEGAKIGERVSFPAYLGEPDEQLNPKKKVWETVQPGFVTTDSLVATWKGEPFTTSAGVCRVATIPGGSIS